MNDFPIKGGNSNIDTKRENKMITQGECQVNTKSDIRVMCIPA